MIELLQSTVFFGYVGYLINKFGMLDSISESTYVLEGKKKFLFTITMVLLGILNLHQPLGNFATVATLGLFWTGATVTFKRKGTATPFLHYLGAVTAIVSTMLGLLLMYGIWLPMFFGIFLSLMVINDKNNIFVTELIWFAMIMLGYISI